MKEIPPLC